MEFTAPQTGDWLSFRELREIWRLPVASMTLGQVDSPQTIADRVRRHPVSP
jgi:hypothetical protein